MGWGRGSASEGEGIGRFLGLGIWGVALLWEYLVMVNFSPLCVIFVTPNIIRTWFREVAGIWGIFVFLREV
jgi:hypothetical protein